MMQLTLDKFRGILDEVPQKLNVIGEEPATEKKFPSKWSKKEIMGHLIDSAANNHQRFVRMQIEDAIALPQYQQNEWVNLQHYNARTWTDILFLWKAYNEHLFHVMKTVKQSTLTNTADFPDYGTLTLRFLMEDYVKHMEHHLKAVLA